MSKNLECQGKMAAVAGVLCAALLSACANMPEPCVTQHERVRPVLQQGFGVEPQAVRWQWDAVVEYLRCEYRGQPSAQAAQTLMAIPGVERAVQPDQIKFLYAERAGWRRDMLALAEQDASTRIERLVAQDDEKLKAYQDAFALYERMWAKGDRRAAHDIAFGLLHGWDGGRKDEHAARYWYAQAYRYTGATDSQQACQMLERALKRKQPDTLNFCD